MPNSRMHKIIFDEGESVLSQPEFTSSVQSRGEPVYKNPEEKVTVSFIIANWYKFSSATSTRPGIISSLERCWTVKVTSLTNKSEPRDQDRIDKACKTSSTQVKNPNFSKTWTYRLSLVSFFLSRHSLLTAISSCNKCKVMIIAVLQADLELREIPDSEICRDQDPKTKDLTWDDANKLLRCQMKCLQQRSLIMY